MSLHRRPPIHARSLSFAAAVVAAVVLAGCGGSDGRATAAPHDGKLRVTDVRIDYPANPKVAAAYFTIVNGTKQADSLLAVSTPAARTAMVHRSTTDDAGRSTMEPVPSLDVPAGSTVSLETGGLHVMLNGVTEDLEVGDEVPLILRFRHADEVSVTAKVVEPGTSADEEDADHDH